jgi:hypothetical protein
MWGHWTQTNTHERGYVSVIYGRPMPSASKFIGLTQTTDFTLWRLFFRPAGEKNNLQKKKSTMLPQAIAALV